MKLGIIGGGQLAQMLALAARPLGVDCLVVEPAPDACAASVAEVIVAPYDDPAALERLARECDAVTVELEEVPAAALDWLAARVPVRPGASVLRTTQDRLLEKQLVRAHGIRTAPFDDEVRGAPAIVKTRRGGFDGRGNRLVRTDHELAAALQEMPAPIVEGLVPFTRELSVVAVRAVDGEVRCWPVVANEHRHGALRRTVAPAPGLTDAMQREAETIARTLLDALGHVGVLAVELFDTPDGLVVNELAPRVHNTGHWTIEGAETSQFEQHVRAVCGLPLGDTALREPSVMLNALGAEPDPDAVLAVPGAHLHRYGKAARPFRKLGHVTVTSPDPAERDRLADHLDPLVPFVV